MNECYGKPTNPPQDDYEFNEFSNPSVIKREAEQARNELYRIMDEKDRFKDDLVIANFSGKVSKSQCMAFSGVLHLGLLESDLSSVANPDKSSVDAFSLRAIDLNRRYLSCAKAISLADRLEKIENHARNQNVYK